MTSHLSHHISSYKKIEYHDMGQMLIDQDGKMKSRRTKQKVNHHMIAEAIIQHDLPFFFVEYKKIKAWAKYLNLDIVMHVHRLSFTLAQLHTA